VTETKSSGRQSVPLDTQTGSRLARCLAGATVLVALFSFAVTNAGEGLAILVGGALLAAAVAPHGD